MPVSKTSAATSDVLTVCEAMPSAQLDHETDDVDVIDGFIDVFIDPWHEVALDTPDERNAGAAERGTVLESGAGSEDPGTAPGAFPPAFQRRGHFV